LWQLPVLLKPKVQVFWHALKPHVLLKYDLICFMVENEHSLTALVAGITMMREATQQTLKKILASSNKLHR